MHRIHAHATLRLLMMRFDSSSFPAKSPGGGVRSFASVTVIALMLSAAGSAERAHAEPARATELTTAATVDPYAAFVHEAAQRFGVPASWISAVLAVESGGDVRALSSQGAMGLMQIMPNTWADLRARHRLGADPYDPRDNILAGAAYLREMHDRYGVPGFLAAYNAGPRRYDDYLAAGRELPAETRRYVNMLAPLVGDEQVNNAALINRRVVTWQESPLFAAPIRESPAAMPSSRHPSSERASAGRYVGGASALAPPADGLFVRHGTASRLP